MDIDWNPLHGSLLSGIDWDPTHSSYGSFVKGQLDAFNLDPRYSQFFREVYLPAVEVTAIAAATILTAGVAPAAFGAAAATGVGLAAGGGVAFGLEAFKSANALGTGQQYGAQAFFGQNAASIGLILGSAGAGLNTGKEPTNKELYEEAKDTAKQIVTLGPPSPAKGTVTTPASRGYAPATPGVGLVGSGAAAASTDKSKALILGMIALAALAA